MNRQRARSAWIGTIPVQLSEDRCLDEVESRCGIRPIRMLLRKSVGIAAVASNWAIAHFHREQDAETFLALGTMVWSTGTRSPIKHNLPCVPGRRIQFTALHSLFVVFGEGGGVGGRL